MIRRNITGPTLPMPQVATLPLGQIKIAIFILLHIPLALASRVYPQVASVHLVLTCLFVLRWALVKPPEYAAYGAAYVASAEVFWRMVNSVLFWELGKYLIALIFIISMIQNRNLKMPALPLWFFLLLLPSTLLTLANTPDLSVARELISFNLSGPFALAVSAWFFSHVHITREQFQRLAIGILAPITGIAAIVVLNVTTNHINWTNDSNFEVVNGFGPNQISGILGLGILIVWFCLLYGNFRLYIRIGLIVLGVTCIITAMLTFSRGGLYTSLLVIGVTGLQAVLKKGQNKAVILYVLVGCVLFAYIVVPRLDDLTNGNLNTRLTDTNLTNRDLLIYADLQIFWQNPLAGVGPGMAAGYQDDLYDIGDVAAHTEYTRMLAEHGILGGIALVLLVVMFISGYQQNWTLPIARNIVLGCGLWATVMMTHSAMRIAAVSFMFGLLFARFDFDGPPPKPIYQNRFFSGFYNPRLPPG